MGDSSSNFFSLMGGVAAGFILGVLFAPEKGSVTRERIMEKLDELSDDITEGGENLLGKVKRKLHLEPSELEQHIDHLLDQAATEGEQAIEILERKLQQLREANQDLKSD